MRANSLHKSVQGKPVCLNDKVRHRRRIHALRVVRAAAHGGGPSGLDINGFRPTSPQGWYQMATKLREANVKVVSPQEVNFAQQRGTPLVDIRPVEAYEEGHLPGAVSCPLYQAISGWSPWKVARRLGYAAFGVLQGTEVNPNFLEEAGKVLTPEGGAVLYCSTGALEDPYLPNKLSHQTRSLVAAYQLISAGYSNISVMKGGYAEWQRSGRDIEAFEYVDP